MTLCSVRLRSISSNLAASVSPRRSRTICGAFACHLRSCRRRRSRCSRCSRRPAFSTSPTSRVLGWAARWQEGPIRRRGCRSVPSASRPTRVRVFSPRGQAFPRWEPPGRPDLCPLWQSRRGRRQRCRLRARRRRQEEEVVGAVRVALLSRYSPVGHAARVPPRRVHAPVPVRVARLHSGADVAVLLHSTSG